MARQWPVNGASVFVAGTYLDVGLNVLIRRSVKDQELHSGILDNGGMINESRFLRLRI